jgi:lysophospholipase L1-like esterase
METRCAVVLISTLECPVRWSRILLSFGLFCSTLLPVLPAHAAAPAQWTGTWTTAPVPAENKSALFSTDTTLRQLVHVSLGGSTVRVTFTNEFGTQPLVIGAASIALPTNGDLGNDGAIAAAGSMPLTFSGHAGTTIPAGAVWVSDPVEFKLGALSNLVVTIFLPGQTLTTLTAHGFANTTNLVASGNQLTAASLVSAQSMYSWHFLKDVEVDASGAGSIVTLGDSITDGSHSTRDKNARWPDVLAERLQANKSTRGLGILNVGIGGNRVLHDGTGPSALARFDRDVLAQAGVKYLVLLESINDIGHAADPKKPYDPVTADDLIAGLSQLVQRAHTHGIKVIGATLTPYGGAGYSSPAGETMRQAVNQWIRTSKELDGVIDFEKATQDPANPAAYAAFADSGDHLHPSDAGYKAMGDAIDLKLFSK